MTDIMFTSKGRIGVAIRVRPGATNTKLIGPRGDWLVIDVAAPPERGKANKELVRFLAKLLGIRKDDVEVVSGLTSRQKRVILNGVDRKSVEIKLGLGDGKGKTER